MKIFCLFAFTELRSVFWSWSTKCTKAKPGEEMFFTIAGMGQSLILLGSAFQESEMHLSSQGFSLSMLSLPRTLLLTFVCFQTKFYCSARWGLEGHQGLQGPEHSTKLSPGTEPAALALTCVPKAKDTQNIMKMYLCPSSHSATSLQPWACLPCSSRFSLLWRFYQPSNISLI